MDSSITGTYAASNVTSRQPTSSSSTSSAQISGLISYARHNYRVNPTEASAALLRALKLNGQDEEGAAAYGAAVDRLRRAFGTDVADHIASRQLRLERAMKVVEELLDDESTLLHESNRQHLLKQTMEDGSSVLCRKCGAVVASNRWQQHRRYWCQAAKVTGEKNNDGENGSSEEEE